MAAALQENNDKKKPQSQELWLANNQIEDEGTIALAEALDQCESLKVLEFSNNGISEQQLQFVTVMLRHRSSSSSSSSSHIVPSSPEPRKMPSTLQTIIAIDEHCRIPKTIRFGNDN